MNIVQILELFIWFMVLWPLLIGVIYLVWKKGVIARKGKFILSSVAVGYLVFLFGGFPLTLLSHAFLKVLGISGESANGENVRHTVVMVLIVIQCLLPILSTHYIAKKFS